MTRLRHNLDNHHLSMGRSGVQGADGVVIAVTGVGTVSAEVKVKRELGSIESSSAEEARPMWKYVASGRA